MPRCEDTSNIIFIVSMFSCHTCAKSFYDNKALKYHIDHIACKLRDKLEYDDYKIRYVNNT